VSADAWRELRALIIAGHFGEAADRAAALAGNAADETSRRLFEVMRASAEMQRSAAPEPAIAIAGEALTWARAHDAALLTGASAHTLATAQSMSSTWRMAPVDEQAFRVLMEEAAAAYTAANELEAAIGATSLIADSHARDKQFDEAFAVFAKVDTLAREAALPVRAAENATRVLDVGFRAGGEIEPARVRAVELWNAVDPEAGNAELALAIVPHLADQFPNAGPLLAGAAQILENKNRLISAWSAWNAAATIAFQRSRMPDARAFAEQSIRVARLMQFAAGESDARGTRATALSYLGHFSEAEEELTRLQSMPTAPAILFGTVVLLIGNYLALKRVDRAEELAHQIVAALEPFGMTPLLSTAWLVMGNVMSARGRGDVAIAAWNTGIEVDLAIGDKYAHASKLAAIALTKGTSGARTEALKIFDDADRLLEGDTSQEAAAARADVAQQRAIILSGRAALEPLEKAAEFWLAARAGTQAATALTQHGLTILGLAAGGVDDLLRALNDFERADAIFRENGLRNSSWKTARFAFIACQSLMKLREVPVDADAARRWLAVADEDIDLLQAGYTNADPLEAMTTSMQQRVDMLAVYRDGIEFHLAGGALVEAFEWIEKMKGRVLLDALAKALVDRRGELQRTRAASFAEVQEMLHAEEARLGRRILIAQCFAGERHLVLLGVRADWPEPRLFDLQLDTAALARDLVAVLGDADAMETAGEKEVMRRAELCVLARTMAEWCDEEDLIAILPGGFLHLVPMHGLWIVDRPLIARNRVVFVPSASVLRHCLAIAEDDGGNDDAMVFGDPRSTLDWADDEARTIAGVLHVEPVIGTGATIGAFMDAIRSRGLIHYAGHALFDASDALASRIELADGDLTAREIVSLRDGRCRFVALSGCETAVAEVNAGDEIVGLSRALLHAGAASLLLTQWEVDDDSAAFFMNAFYGQWRERRRSRADAFRNAQLATMREFPGFSSWAAFVLIGAWT